MIQNLLPDKLLSFDYYKSKLPLYLQNSYGFVEHFRIWSELLSSRSIYCSEETFSSNNLLCADGSSVTYVITVLFSILNIFDLNCQISHLSAYEANEHYLQLLNGLEDSDSGSASDVLDKIGSLFGLQRKFSLVVSGSTIEFDLDNRDFLLLIKCTIVKNYFDGSYSQVMKYYNAVGLPVFVLTNDLSARCDMYLIVVDDSIYSLSEDVKNMFLAGILTIESVGIQYSYSILGVDSLAIFDSINAANCWDSGVFVI